MAKLEKIDQKQLPQVILLGVLSLGIFGFFGMQMLTPAKPPPKAAADKKEATATGEGLPRIAAAPVGGRAYPSQYNPDPFRAVVRRRQRSEMEAMLRRAFGQAPTPGRPRGGGPMTSAGRPRPLPPVTGVDMVPYPAGGGAVPSERPVVEAVAVRPVRPELTVTGIINPREGQSMALVALGSQQRILQVGDTLPNNYRVRRVDLDGVLLTDGKDIFFVGLGAKSQSAREAPAAAPTPEGKAGS